jgi:primary-amine oxidase
MFSANKSLYNVHALKSVRVATVFSFFLLVALADSVSAQSAKHPLDGLTAPEYWAILRAMEVSGHLDSKTRFPLIQLREPPKGEVLKWMPGQSFRREAMAIVKH